MRDEMTVKINSSKRSLYTDYSDISGTQSIQVYINIKSFQN